MENLQTRRSTVADLIRWGPTIAGVLIAAAVFTTVNALWLALAYGSADNIWRDNLQWFVGGTAAASLFLAGLLAGLFSGIRGIGAGLVNAATAWGLFFLLSIAAVLPGAFNLNSELRDSFAAFGDSRLTTGMWTVFWSLLAGALLALTGGALGGSLRRPAGTAAVEQDGVGPVSGRPEQNRRYPDPDVDREHRQPHPEGRLEESTPGSRQR